jgi:serine protease Do
MNSRFSHKRLLAGVLILALCLATGSSAQAEPAIVFAQLQRSTGFVVVNKGNGQMSYGTCWVSDIDKKLVITNVHVVGTYTDVTVAFARYDAKGVLLTKSSAYAQSHYIGGKVIYRDVKRDLALIRLNSLPRSAQAIALAEKSIQPAQKIWSIGNSGMAGKQLEEGTLWRQRTGTVKKGFFWRTKLNHVDQMLEVSVIQTDSGVMPGDSGGPVVDAQGKLVAVVSCTTTEGDYGIDVAEVKTFLQRALAKAPAAPHPAAGTWTVTWSSKGKELYAGLTLNNNGTAVWQGGKDFPGSYTYKKDKSEMVFTLPNSGVNGTVTLTWTKNDQFQFTIQYSEGPITFTAVRR